MEQRDERTEHVLRQKNDPHVCRPQRKDTETRRTGTDSIPFIGVLPPLDTMLTIKSYFFPESPIEKYQLGRRGDRLLGFFLHRLHFVQLQRNGGRTRTESRHSTSKAIHSAVPVERRSGPAHDDGQYSVLSNILWNTGQDKMTFMIPYCDTVFTNCVIRKPSPLYAIPLWRAKDFI